MDNLTYTLFNLGFIIVFAMLGIFTISVYIPDDDKFRNYRKGRITLGIGFFLIASYCVIRIFIPQHYEDYPDIFMRMLFSFVFSWLNYAAFLFFIASDKYKIRRFMLDGGIPTGLMAVAGIAGFFLPQIQTAMIVLFGVIFGIKCTYLCYVCLREYRKCANDLDNFYGESPDIKWIYSLIWLTFALSVSTIVSIFWPAIHIVYDFAAPAIYIYMVFKIVNFVPAKIDNVRISGAVPAEPQTKVCSGRPDLSDKLKEKVDKWVDAKMFCKADINIKDVAREIGTNHNYLSAYINNCLHMTFQVWLNTLRIEESKTILTDGQKRSIEDVGIMVGFSQSYNFSRWFKIVTGTTPFQWRKQH